jgi:hypothetical protein
MGGPPAGAALRRSFATLALLLAAGCGYGFSAGGRLTGGIAKATVRPLENRSTQPDLGALLSAALREELALRGALARAEGGAVITGAVSASVPAPAAPDGAIWRFSVEVRLRLVDGDRVVAERALRRDVDYSAGVDALETEGRRAQAARRLSVELARELVAQLSG